MSITDHTESESQKSEKLSSRLDIEISVVRVREYQQAGFSRFLESARKIGSSFLLYYSACIYNHVTGRLLSDEQEVLNNFCSSSELDMTYIR